MKKTEAELLSTHEISPGYFLHIYHAPALSRESEPGQFVEIRVGDGPHPILRRPFSILRAKGEEIQVLFKVVGEGTRLLSMKKKGALIDMIGPIGTPFELQEKPAVLVAGGIGCAPLYFLVIIEGDALCLIDPGRDGELVSVSCRRLILYIYACDCEQHP